MWGEIWKSVLRCGGCGKSLGRCGKVCWGVRGDVKRGVEGVGKCWGRRGKVWWGCGEVLGKVWESVGVWEVREGIQGVGKCWGR